MHNILSAAVIVGCAALIATATPARNKTTSIGGGKQVECRSVFPVFPCYSLCGLEIFPCQNACYDQFYNCWNNGGDFSACNAALSSCLNICQFGPCMSCCGQVGVSKCHTNNAGDCCSAAYLACHPK